jgi:alanine racemase
MRTPPNWLELDWDALKHNARAVQDYIGAERTLWAVVKADAYGHNAAQATNALLQAGVAHFIVASLDEAVALREALPQRAFRLMTLYPPTTPDEWRTAAEYGVESVIDSREGYAHTHFACAESDPEFTAEQLRMFLEGVRRLRAGGFPETPLHAAASAGLLTAPDSLLNAVRCGLLLYGIAPTGLESHPLCAQLRPVLSWRARVISVRTIPKGQSVSYGARFRAARPTRVATLSVGYADGYPIGLTNRAPIALRGKLAPQIGRVCMDMLMVDATELPEVQVGDVATLIGQDGAASVRVETLARLLETTPHELTTRLGKRVARPQV